MVNQTATCEPTMPTGFSMIHSNRMEDLRKVAVQWIRNHPLKPLENELFIVQSNGMAQWLKLALADNNGCGISAALDIQLPARFLWQAYRAVLGEATIPRQSPYDKVRLVWRLLRLLPEVLKDDVFAPLRQYLADDADQRKRYQLACHIADLYDQYQVYRADWLEDWINGADQLRNAMGAPTALPPQQAWQAALWRHIQRDIPKRERDFSRSGLHQRFLTAAHALKVRPAGLPRRVIVFGISSLPKQALEALNAVSRHSQVLLFVHNPCRHYWADIIEDRELLRIENARHKCKSPSLANLSPELLHQHANPLLAAWAKQGRDYIGLLYGYDQPETYRENFAQIDLFSDFTVEGQQADLLRQVQQAILELKPLPAMDEDKPLVLQEDQSIRFQLAHSRQREVEILQNQLLSDFGRNPDLKPQDIIVMTPDIDAYTPHIEAVFGNSLSHDPRYIPFTIADRPESNSVPMLQALENLLQLPSSRMAAGDLMDLLEVPAFRTCFGLEEEDLAKLHRWIQGAGIRWGLSAEQRRDFDLPAGIEQNTWWFGLRRLLLGYAVGANAPWQGIEPYDDIGGLEAALVGPLAVILERLENYWRMLRQPATAQDWHGRILGLMQDFFLPTSRHDELTQRRVEEVVGQWLNACSDANLAEPLTLPVVREALIGEMRDASVSQRFLAGRVNFCTLMPMRAIPFKMVCLLGMNDGEYPRSAPPLDFDLMSGPGRYRPGDRSRREDDRYLCLEALLSAREKLYISYIGNSVQDNSERMPSVLVGQLRDYLAAGWRVAEPATDTQPGERLLQQLTCRHPLQPFSRRYFQPERFPRLFTYAHEWRGVFNPPAAPPDADQLKALKFEGALQLNPLIRFLKNPVKHFFNQRLGIYFNDIDVTTENQEPFHLDSLAPFGAGMQLLAAGLEVAPDKSHDAVVQAAQRLRRTGELPHGGFGERAAMHLTEPVLRMLAHHHDLCEIWRNETTVVEIRCPILLDGCDCDALEDWLDGIRRRNNGIETPAPSGKSLARWEFYPLDIFDNKGLVTPKSCLISPWVKHLAGCAQGLVLTSYLITPDGCAALKPIERPAAQSWLDLIIDKWWQGMLEPLPVTAKTAFAYLTAPHSKDRETAQTKTCEAARKAYEGDGYYYAGELGYGDGAYLKRCYPDFSTLWETDTRGNRFPVLAEALYAPLVKAVKKGADA